MRTKPWQLDTFFGPIEEMLRHIATRGTLEVDECGLLQFKSTVSGKRFAVVATLKSYACLFSVLHVRHQLCTNADPLFAFADTLEAGQVTEVDVNDCIERVAIVRAQIAAMPLRALIDAQKSAVLRSYMDATEQSVHRDEG